MACFGSPTMLLLLLVMVAVMVTVADAQHLRTTTAACSETEKPLSRQRQALSIAQVNATVLDATLSLENATETANEELEEFQEAFEALLESLNAAGMSLNYSSDVPSSYPSLAPSTVPVALPSYTSPPTIVASSDAPSAEPSAGPTVVGAPVVVSPTVLAPVLAPVISTTAPESLPPVTTLPPMTIAPLLPPPISAPTTAAPISSPVVIDNTTRSQFPSAAPTEFGVNFTMVPTICPGISNEDRIAQILAILDAVADPDAIRNNGTPQGLATTWLLEDDELQVCPVNVVSCQLVQRWSLAVMYYSTGGESWFQCSANVNATDDCGAVEPFVGDTRFLSAGSECEWAGISCQNSCVTEMEFGTKRTGARERVRRRCACCISWFHVVLFPSQN
jgi:hypothetical protein